MRFCVFIVVFWSIFCTVTGHCRKPAVFLQKPCTEQKDDYSISMANLTVTVSRNGGRITSFQRAGKEMLIRNNIHPLYYGGTLWISPQSENWPASVEIDRAPYDIDVCGDTLSMTSKPDKKTGLMVHKEFCFSIPDTSLQLVYTIINTSADTIWLSPWDVLRTPPGISFFPAGENSGVNHLGIDSSYMKDGVVWCPTYSLQPEKGQKLFHTAKYGWLAHYANGLLLVKDFPDITVAEMPPGQGEAEIYIAPGGVYIELENHGRYVTLIPGDSTVYHQKWFLLNAGEQDAEGLIRMVNEILRSPSGF